MRWWCWSIESGKSERGRSVVESRVLGKFTHLMLVSFDLKSGAWVPVRSAYLETTSEREKVMTSSGVWSHININIPSSSSCFDYTMHLPPEVFTIEGDCSCRDIRYKRCFLRRPSPLPIWRSGNCKEQVHLLSRVHLWKHSQIYRSHCTGNVMNWSFHTILWIQEIVAPGCSILFCHFFVNASYFLLQKSHRMTSIHSFTHFTKLVYFKTKSSFSLLLYNVSMIVPTTLQWNRSPLLHH